MPFRCGTFIVGPISTVLCYVWLYRYVRTSILPQEAIDQVQESGVGFATPEDAGQCALRILSDGEINVRSIFLLPRKWAARGFLDLDLEDYRSNELVQEIQAVQVKAAPVELGLVSR